ncbi:MAG: hypothetical protein OWQ48_01915 [Desulfurococcus sp.]|nr:hypothetical protein [Desulfurococcus sp.]
MSIMQPITVESLPGGFHRISLFEKTVYLRISVCSRRKNSLDEELEELGERTGVTIAIIPLSMTSIPQIVQGALHFIIYKKEFSRFKNKGLLLLMLSTGYTQISKALSKARDLFEGSLEYYLVELAEEPPVEPGWQASINGEYCKPLKKLEQVGVSDFTPLVKNLHALLEMI